jgi:co-chaperonin GroES (HSP10)
MTAPVIEPGTVVLLDGSVRRPRPLRDVVVVARDRWPDVSPGGLILPDQAKKIRRPAGEVMLIGPGRYARKRMNPFRNQKGELWYTHWVETGGRVPVRDLSVGDRVFLNSQAGLDWELDYGGRMLTFVEANQIEARDDSGCLPPGGPLLEFRPISSGSEASGG